MRGFSWDGYQKIYEEVCIKDFNNFCKIFIELPKTFNKVAEGLNDLNLNSSRNLFEFIKTKICLIFLGLQEGIQK